MRFPFLSTMIGEGSHAAELLKGSSLALVMRVAGIAVTYLFNFFVARMFGASAVGAFALATTLVMIFGMLSRLGFDRAIVKFVASSASVGKFAVAVSQYRLGLSLVSVCGSVLSIALFLGANLIASRVFGKPHLAIVLQIAAPAILLYSVSLYNAEALRGLKQIGQFAAIRYILIYFLAIPALFVLRPQLSAEVVPVAAFLVASMLAAVISLSVAWRKFRVARPAVVVGLGTMLAISVPMLLSNSMGMIISWTDILMLGRFTSDDQVGIYSITFKLAFVTGIMLNAVNSISTPKFAELHAARDTSQLSVVMHQTTRLLFYTAVPILVVLLIAGQPLLGLFGTDFEAGYAALVILVFGQFVSTISGPVGNLLQMTGHERTFLKIVAVMAVVNVILNMLLIPKYGIVGAAAASAVTLIANNIACVILIYRKLHFVSIYLPFTNRLRA